MISFQDDLDFNTINYLGFLVILRNNFDRIDINYYLSNFFLKI